jgi:hypothetical protein
MFLIDKINHQINKIIKTNQDIKIKISKKKTPRGNNPVKTQPQKLKNKIKNDNLSFLFFAFII